MPLHALVSRAAAADAHPVVLVHGLGISSRHMLPTAERLDDEFRVLVPDLPGYGRSGKPSPSLTLAGLADALELWLARLGVTTATFVANSYGCQIVVEMALRRPDLVERAVLVGPTVDARGRTLRQQSVRLLIDGLREPPSLVLLAATEYLRAGPRTFVRATLDALHDRLESKLPLVTAPTLVVRGARDPLVSDGWAREVARLLPHGRLAVVPGAAHAVNYNAPEQLARLVRKFVAEG